MQDFETPKARYRNLIDRAHFPAIPYSLVPFRLSSGRNVGILVVIRLDRGGRPLLIATVNTCGCYVSMAPTAYLTPEAYPEGWTSGAKEVYGEWFPGMIQCKQEAGARLLVSVRPEVQRVMGLDVVDSLRDGLSKAFDIQKMPIFPMADLERLPVDGGRRPFFL